MINLHFLEDIQKLFGIQDGTENNNPEHNPSKVEPEVSSISLTEQPPQYEGSNPFNLQELLSLKEKAK